MPDRRKVNKKYGNICLLQWTDSIISQSVDNLFMLAHSFFLLYITILLTVSAHAWQAQDEQEIWQYLSLRLRGQYNQ